MPRKSQKKTIIDGKLDDKAVDIETDSLSAGSIPSKTKARNINELLGRKDSLYPEKTAGAYEDSLRRMGLTDLERHATQVGITPVGNRARLVGRLLDEYRKRSSGYFGTYQEQNSQPKDPQKVLDILKKAR